MMQPGRKNPYEILGINRDADTETIKQAFKSLALKHHTDKGGDKDTIQLIIEARNTLIDPAQRRRFDEEWEAGASAEFAEEAPMPSDAALLTSTAGHFSDQYKARHAQLVSEYLTTPLRIGSARAFFKSFVSTVKALPIRRAPASYPAVSRGEPLNPSLAVEVFNEFLQGFYKDPQLAAMKRYFATEMGKVKGSDALLYEGIYTLMATPESAWTDDILLAFKKMTDYAKSNVSAAMPVCVALFQSKYFRDLFGRALYRYWQSEGIALSPEKLRGFDGREATKDMLINFQQMLSRFTEKRHEGVRASLLQQVRVLSLMYRFEKDVQKTSDAVTAEDLREKAFHIIDWLPAFLGAINQATIVNFLMQAGTYFQRASVVERHPAMQMADEGLALSLYAEALLIVRRTTPNVELYVRTQSLKWMAGFRYPNPRLEKMIQFFQERTVSIANIFPFYEGLQSNVALFSEQDQSIMLMRQFLHGLMGIVEANHSSAHQVPIDHDAVTVLYQAYEATLKNWYEDHYDPAQEEHIRVRLMEELLAHHHWSFANIDENVDALGVNVERNLAGWMRPSRKLPIPADPSIAVFQSVDGLEVDYKEGSIAFSFKAVRAEDPAHRQLLTAYDFGEVVERNLTNGFFSLDGVDPDMQYHPFNLMRFSPSGLYRTQMFHSMLMTDYLLKFFTVGREVRGRVPYSRRPLDELLKDLPPHLRSIIEDFHREQRSSESTHRFWIEAGEVMVAQDASDDQVHRLAMGGIKMVVKKHQMVLDGRGNLVDADESDEGWNIYVLTQSQREAMRRVPRTFVSPAMIFVEGKGQVFFYEDETFSALHGVEDYADHLSRVWRAPRDAEGQVVRAPEDGWFNYKLTREVTRQAGKAHRFSAEYCFALEFTAHYNEFAQYFPEFGRLRELSKVALLVNFMNGIRQSNQEKIAELTALLGNAVHWRDREATIQRAIDDIERQYQSIYRAEESKLSGKISSMFADMRSQIADLPSKIYTMLGDIYGRMGRLKFDAYSPEVEKICAEMLRENEEEITRKHGPGAWVSNRDHIQRDIQGQRAELAEKMTEKKWFSCYDQLCGVFSSKLLSGTDRLAIIGAFLEGRFGALTTALIRADTVEAKKQLAAAIPGISTAEVEYALDHHAPTIARITTRINESNLSDVTRQKSQKIAELRQIASKEKTEIRQHKEKREMLIQRLRDIGLPETDPEINMTGKCLWVPANVHHDVGAGHSRFVYGGVLIAPKVQQLAETNPLRTAVLTEVFGGGRQLRIDQNYLIAARAASAAAGGERGSVNTTYNLRLQEVLQQRTAEAAAYHAGRAAAVRRERPAPQTATGGSGSGGREPPRPPVVSQPPPRAATGGSGSGGREPPRSPVVSPPPRAATGGSGSGGREPPRPPVVSPPPQTAQTGAYQAGGAAAARSERPIPQTAAGGAGSSGRESARPAVVLRSPAEAAAYHAERAAAARSERPIPRAAAGGAGSGGGEPPRPPVVPPPPPPPPSSEGSGSGRPSSPPRGRDPGSAGGSSSTSGPAGRPPSPTTVFYRGQEISASASRFEGSTLKMAEYNHRNPCTIIPAGARDSFQSKIESRLLREDFILYRAGENEPGKEIGQFYTIHRPASELQVRIDSAVRPVWDGGSTSVLEQGYAVRIPKGTIVYVGETASQGGAFLGGVRQIFIPTPWEKGAEVVRDYQLGGGDTLWNRAARAAPRR